MPNIYQGDEAPWATSSVTYVWGTQVELEVKMDLRDGSVIELFS